MLCFHRSKILLEASNQLNPPTRIGEFDLHILSEPHLKLDHFKQLFTLQTHADINIKSGILDNLLRSQLDKNTFATFILLLRLENKSLVTTSIADLSTRLNFNRTETLNALSSLEEAKLITITGNKLLQINILKNWF